MQIHETEVEQRMSVERTQEIKQNNRSFGRWIVITILLMVITTVCGILMFRMYLNSFSQDDFAKKYSQYYVMITQERNSSFWNAVYEGAKQAGAEQDIYVDMLGESLPHDYTREDLMRIAIASEVDGIIVTADESEEMTNLINEAVAQGIPVVTLYGDNTRSERCSFVGVGGYNLGKEYGEQVLGVVREHPELTRVNVAVLVSANASDAGQNIITSGVQDTIDRAAPRTDKINMSIISVDATNAFSVEESIRDLFMEEELPDVIICLNELHTTCVYQAVVDYNKVGKVAILGYYDSETIIKAIDRGVIRSTIAIDTDRMGRYCVEALSEYNQLGYTSQYFTTDIELIDKKNVSSYMEEGE